MAQAKMKTKSIQLPESYWDFIEGRARDNITSAAAVIRSFIAAGARLSIMDDVIKMKIESIPTLKEGLFRELRAQMRYFNTGPLNFSSMTREDIANYFENNPDDFDKARAGINRAFAILTQNELISVFEQGGF